MLENPNVQGFVQWLEKLSASGTHRVSAYTAKDVRCRNPLVEGVGPQAMAAIYAKIFEGTASVKIKVINQAMSVDGYTVFLRWDRLVMTTAGQFETLSGVTELMVGLDGKIASVTEYWDDLPTDAPKSLWARLFKR